MGKEIQPIASIGTQPATHGRIRFGTKTKSKEGRAIPKALDQFRLTSGDREAVEQLAALYGGTPTKWDDTKANPRHQWEVLTEADTLRVWLPPDALSQHYELWKSGSNVRRCDGVTCEVAGRDDMEYRPCLCIASDDLVCKPTTRLNLIFPEIRFGGVWRLDTGSWAAAREMPAMVRLIEQMQQQVSAISVATLRLEARQQGGGAKQFVVPVLSVDHTPQQIMGGSATARHEIEATNPQQVAIGMGDLHLRPDFDPNTGDHILDAVVVDDDDDVFLLPNAPRDRVDLSERQIEGLRSGAAKWDPSNEGRVVKA